MATVRWNGNGRRLALGYEWPRQGAVAEVTDPAAVETLLAQPGGQFSVIEEAPPPDPLPEGEGVKKVKKLRLKQAQEE